MRYFPVFVDLQGRDVLVVGGGEQAVQKVRLLLKSPARITVVAESVAAELVALGASGRILLQRRDFAPADLAGKALAYVATGTPARNAAVAAAAREAGVPVNAVDEPQVSTFITPAIVDRSPVTVAIGTEGTSPVIAREIKTRLEAWLPAGFGRLAAAAGALRERVAQAIPDVPARRRFWERLLKGPFRQASLAGDTAAAEAAVATALDPGAAGGPPAGRIVLVGCGPGDADLLTLKAQQALQEADVLVVDRLVSEQVLEHARRDAERIYVGKTPGGPSAGQAEINAILVREARAGRVVARLKGGDPFIFGRAAEEMAAAREAGIEVEVVPGITAAHACAARIGLPVTQRGSVRQFSVLTGATAGGDAELDWPALARDGAAFAVYMGIASAPHLRQRLLAAGARGATPVVIVENGTLASERVVETRLADLDAAIRAERLKGPAIIFVGLDWTSAGLQRPRQAVRHVARPKARDEQAWSPSAVAEATQWVMG